ncbi:hypothetical protein GS429_04135 [Natronorubrum sp. JWXQ-INN-674]|uniref:Uncharacterized protein n=1 Tax=Natronorubrum halalkaliphilum TaxID=2691917 RepID=A0A6B0VIC0_9EURY|nr:hypothetical protein [Natronorubrum halalkaliphilum]MXV61264.1 hypothetical protein [Natronorubrum halalkaliphilum]
MMRRHYLAASGSIAALAVSSRTGSGTETQTRTRTQETTDDTDGVLEFDGAGATITDEFSLTDGLAIAEGEYDGDSNFVVELVALEGAR